MFLCVQRTFREIMFLQEMNNHENIIRCGGGGQRGEACVCVRAKGGRHRSSSARQQQQVVVPTACPPPAVAALGAAGCSTCSRRTMTGGWVGGSWLIGWMDGSRMDGCIRLLQAYGPSPAVQQHGNARERRPEPRALAPTLPRQLFLAPPTSSTPTQPPHPPTLRACVPACLPACRDIYLVFEYMETDLHAVIRANILEEVHKQYIMYQIFRSLKFMHSAQLLHRDIKVGVWGVGGAAGPRQREAERGQWRHCASGSSMRQGWQRLPGLRSPAAAAPGLLPRRPPPRRPLQPSNVLLNSECQVKMADFGLARSVAQLATEEGNPVLTDYVATRWYRAPEILLSSHRYTYGVDMWACGACVRQARCGQLCVAVCGPAQSSCSAAVGPACCRFRHHHQSVAAPSTCRLHPSTHIPCPSWHLLLLLPLLLLQAASWVS